MTDTEMLRGYIDKSGLKLQFIAEKVGISREALSQKINNKSEFKAREIQILCDLVGIDSPEKQHRVFFMPN